MTHHEPARTVHRPFRTIRLAALLLVVAVAASIGNSVLRSWPSASTASTTTASPLALIGSVLPRSLGTPTDIAPDGEMVRRPERGGALGEADGLLPDRVTVFDGQYPGVANLDADLRHALRQAATRATRGGVELFVTSGWRSRAYQEELFRQAVAAFGSEAKAAEWVAPPGTSAHESGNAVDIGPLGAAAWLSSHGAAYELCQIYRNEPWHYELRPGASTRGCPRMYADPSEDPRMQS